MPYLIENTNTGQIEARDFESLAAAVLSAARYDGWGAEFARDSQGRIGLRSSKSHIGNNPWLATGEEPPAYGHTSDLEDDEEAMEEVAKAINGSTWGGNMGGLAVVDHAEYLRQMLQQALDEYEGDTGPGQWLTVEAMPDKGVALLAYQWPEGLSEGDPHWGDADAPWKLWGGEALVAAVGGVIQNGYGIDGIDHAEVSLA